MTNGQIAKVSQPFGVASSAPTAFEIRHQTTRPLGCNHADIHRIEHQPRTLPTSAIRHLPFPSTQSSGGGGTFFSYELKHELAWTGSPSAKPDETRPNSGSPRNIPTIPTKEALHPQPRITTTHAFPSSKAKGDLPPLEQPKKYFPKKLQQTLAR